MGGGAGGSEVGRPPGRLEGKERLGQRGSTLHARRQYRRRSAATPVPAAANSNERLAWRSRDDGAQPWPPHRGPVRRRRPFQASAAATAAAVVVSGLLRLREPVGGGTTTLQGKNPRYRGLFVGGKSRVRIAGFPTIQTRDRPDFDSPTSHHVCECRPIDRQELNMHLLIPWPLGQGALKV